MTLATNTNLCHIYGSTSFGEQFQPAMAVDVIRRLTNEADCITVTAVGTCFITMITTHFFF